MQNLLSKKSIIIGTVTVLICLFALTYLAESASVPSEILSPVVGDLEIVSSLEQCTDTKWCFNQHKSMDSVGHGPGGGICQADDTYAWDANLNIPEHDTDNGKPVYAVEQGEVTQTFGDCINAGGSYGQLLIEHKYQDNSWWSGYLHLRDIQVEPGQSVDKETLLGYISNTSPDQIPNHLHFVVYKGQNSRGELVSFDANIVERSFSPKFQSGDYVQTTENLHMRTDPEIDDNIITTVPSGNTGRVVDDEDNGIFASGYCWWHVQFGDDNGWAAEDWLEKIELSTTKSVFTVVGTVKEADGSLAADGLEVVVSNEIREGITATTTLGEQESGKYGVAFVDTENKEVAAEGDTIKVTVKSEGDILGSQTYKLTSEDMAKALALVDVTLGEKEYNPQVSVPPYAPTFGFGNKGTIFTFVIKVENSGTMDDMVDLTASSEPEGLDISLSKNSVTLPPLGSELVYLSATVEDKEHEINITATSRGDSFQKSSCTITISEISTEHPLYFTLSFRNSDVKEHLLKFTGPDLKFDKKSLELTPGKVGGVNFIFDPKTNKRKFEIEISDETTGESIDIPIEMATECIVVTTDFDVAEAGYNFSNLDFERDYCYGMAETSIVYFNFRNGLSPAEEPPDSEVYPNTYALPKEIADDRIKIHHWLCRLNPLCSLQQRGISVDEREEYEKLKNSLVNGRHMILTMWFDSGEGHSVVAYKIIERVKIEEKATEAYILVYDNNQPYKEDKLDIISFPYLKYNLSTGDLSYSISDMGKLEKFIVSIPTSLNDLLATLVLIECPVNVTIKDQHGRIISSDGTNEIPDANMVITDEEKAFYLPADMRYSVEIDAYDSGSLNFTRVSPVGNDVSVTKVEDVSITKETKASIEIKPEVVDYTMEIDYNADGTVDEKKNSKMAEEVKAIEEHPSWDVNSDGEINISDLVLVGKHFGESGSDIVGDVNNDGQVNIFDLVLIGNHFGE